MKKSLLALAVLGAFAGAASAQTNVTVYGLVDIDVARTSVSGGGANAGTRYLLDEGNNGLGRNGSRLGFKGTEDLGGGLSAIFQLESGFDATTGASTQGGLLFGRQAFVGLSSKTLGTVALGRQYTTMHIALDSIDPFGTGMSGNIEGGVSGLTGGGQLFSSAGTRMNNSISYNTPNFSGFSATAMYGFGETTAGFSNNQQYGVSASYDNGPIRVVGSYNQLKPFVTNAAGAVTTNTETKTYMVGGTYNFNVVKLHAAYGNTETDDNLAGVQTADNRNYMLGLSAPLGAFTLIGSYVRQDDRTGFNADRDQYALGAIYNLSKRTNVYTSAGYLRARGTESATNVNANVFQVGLQHRF
ncbi:porin [Noviherbaspirillum cavernae]|uniref:Porin n=1 Tax=Noviherbaspirillum cavernae TaxID=2320862 RepID=A0A418X3Z1_9BURK|nr:porin [Noviherbaspirillum cavernae]RJG07178.1 porin [Noviherbaspirillum cavernae]